MLHKVARRKYLLIEMDVIITNEAILALSLFKVKREAFDNYIVLTSHCTSKVNSLKSHSLKTFTKCGATFKLTVSFAKVSVNSGKPTLIQNRSGRAQRCLPLPTANALCTRGSTTPHSDSYPISTMEAKRHVHCHSFLSHISAVP